MSYWDKIVELSDLNGKVIKEITGLNKDSDEVRIFTEDGNEYLFYHDQDCCESVNLNDFEGDAADLAGATISLAEEVTNAKEGEVPEYAESYTWTFYKIETSKGGLWMRWLGESNGCYSESVDVIWVNKPDQDALVSNGRELKS